MTSPRNLQLLIRVYSNRKLLMNTLDFKRINRFILFLILLLLIKLRYTHHAHTLKLDGLQNYDK